MNTLIKTKLQLVADNPGPARPVRLDARALHSLADKLAGTLRAGRSDLARATVRQLSLSPIGIAAVATWMLRQGVSEADILRLVA